MLRAESEARLLPEPSSLSGREVPTRIADSGCRSVGRGAFIRCACCAGWKVQTIPEDHMRLVGTLGINRAAGSRVPPAGTRP